MSKQKEKLNETALKELMVVIRRNSQESPCITNFENLLHEIDYPVFINTVVNSMFDFLTEVFELFGAVDKVPQKKFKSKMLTTEFIDPLRFFGRVKQMADKDMDVRAAIELYQKKTSGATLDTNRKPVRLSIEEAEHIINKNFIFVVEEEGLRYVTRTWKEINVNGLPEMRCEYLKELARKEMLVWNYIPAIIKAVLQTKRRSLDMDNNSKRFK